MDKFVINPFNENNYYKEMEELITFQFEESVVFKKFLRLINTEFQDLQSMYKALMQDRSVDTATGKQLDIIGKIVGQERILIGLDAYEFFGFEGAVNAQTFSDLTDMKKGGYWWSLDAPQSGNVILNDEQYRLFIKAKIMKNVTRATPECIINFVRYVFGASRVFIATDSGAKYALILISDELDPFERELLKYFIETKYKSYFVPKPLGVGIEFGVLPVLDYFGFVGAPEAKGYGTLDPITGIVSGGGTYAKIGVD